MCSAELYSLLKFKFINFLSVFFMFIMSGLRLPVQLHSLRDEELRYELAIRGQEIPPLEDIPELLVRLEHVIDVPVDISRAQLNPVSILPNIRSKVDEIYNVILDLSAAEGYLPNTVNHITSRLNHLVNFVNDILSLELMPSLRKDFLLVASQLAGFQADLGSFVERTNSGEVQNPPSRDVASSLSFFNDHRRLNFSEKATNTPLVGSGVSVPPPPSFNHSNLEALNFGYSINNPPTFNPSFGRGMSAPEPGLNLYKPIQRENPIDEILRNSGTFNVESPLSILGFFKIMIRLIECLSLVQFTDLDLYSMLASVSLRVLRSCVLMAKQQSWPVQRFHAFVLEKYVPRLIYQQWLTEHYYHIQVVTENFCDYVESKRFFAAVLKVSDSEPQIVSNILQGLNAETRSRLVFSSEPRTFVELTELVARVSNYALVDSMACPPVPFSSASSPSRPTGNRTRRPATCYHCGRPGHVVRDCYRRRAQISNSASPMTPEVNNLNSSESSRHPL